MFLLLSRIAHNKNSILKNIVSTSGLHRNILGALFSAFILLSPLQAQAAVDVLISTFMDNPDPAPRGGVIAYTIIASNNGADPAAGVTVTIPLPLTTTYEGATMTGGTCPAAGTVTAGNNIVCTLTSNLAGGADSTILLNIGTTGTTGNTINLSATVATSSTPENAGNNTATQNTTINNGADLRLDVVVGSPNPVTAGGNINWAISGSNQGPNDATNSSIAVTLPASLTFVSGSGGGFNCSAAGQVVTCSGPALANGATFSGLNLVTKVSGATSGDVVIAPRISSTVADPDPNNNTLPTQNITPVDINDGADLQITQNTPNPSPGRSGEVVDFSLQAANLGPGSATNGVTVTYQLPTGFTFISATPSGANWGTCSVSGSNLVTCINSGNYIPGRTDTIAIQATAPIVTNVTPFNNIVATIAHNAGNSPDPVSSNNTAAVNLNVSPDGAGLTLNKTRSPNPVAEGQNITSVLRVSNQGPTDATAGTISVTDTIDIANETFVSFSPTGPAGWSCNNVTSGTNLNPAVPSVTCTYNGLLANGAATNLTIITKSQVRGVLYTATNNAGVACVATQGNPSPKCWFPNGTTTSANATVTQATNSVDLHLTKTASTAGGVTTTLESNETTMTYTLVLTNETPTVDAQNIVVRDPIPGYRNDTPVIVPVVSTNYTQGSTAVFGCNVDGSGVVLCTQSSGVLKFGDTVTFTIPVSRNLNATNPSDPSSFFTNEATVSSTSQGDTNPGNNKGTVQVKIDPIADVEMVSKILTPSTTQAGTEVTYVLTFRNNGPSQAANVSVSDTFTVSASDPGFTVISVTPTNWSSGAPACSGLTPGDSYGAGTTTTLTCTGTTLNSGEQRTVRVVVRPNWKNGQSGGTDWTIPNTASITTTTAENINGTDGGNNSKSAVLTVQAAAVDLLINNNDNVDPLGYDNSSGGNNGQNDVIYTINVVNNGPSLATGVRFTYAITPPTGKTIRFLGDSAVFGPPAGSICNNIGSEVTGPNTLTVNCVYTGAAANLANGASINRYLSVRMLSTPAATGDIHNSIATVFANETDTNSVNNTETEATSIRSDIAVNNLSLSGAVFRDSNNNGIKNAGETGIPGVTITLSGQTSGGVDICTVIPTCSVLTDQNGIYIFSGLLPSGPGGYTVVETQPVGLNDGKDQVGNLGNIAPSSPAGTVINAGSDTFTVPLTASATGYNFGEPAAPTGTAGVSGNVWFDTDHDRVNDSNEPRVSGFLVELLDSNGNVITSTTTDPDGTYSFNNLVPYDGTPATVYSIRFREPTNRNIYGFPVSQDSNPARNGTVNSNAVITGLQLANGINTVEQNLPLDPSGVVYDAVSRQPVPGATVTLLSGGVPVLPSCLVGNQNAQVTGPSGIYQYLLINTNPLPAGCALNNTEFTIQVVQPAGYLPPASALIPPTAGPHVPPVGGVDAIQAQVSAPSGNQPTTYFFSFTLSSNSANVVNNHIPLDPILGGALVITKITPLVNVTRGDLVPYTITATNTLSAALAGINVVDRLPAGFKYRSGSGNINGVSFEPKQSGRDLTWENQTFAAGERKTYKLILVVGTGVGEGEYTNQAWGINGSFGTLISNIANASVRITPDPTFDCSDIIGKVFDDRNANGYQDEGEPGIPNVRVVTVRGLLITSDAEGRFHVTCADVPDSDHGANFVMKLDERTLPSGYRMTTENPRDVRVTRGKMVKLNFGATVHRVIRLDLNDAAFASGQASLLPEWLEALPKLRERLSERPSILRLAYDPGGGDKKLAQQRLDTVADAMRKLWKQAEKDNNNAPAYPLVIEKALEGQP